MAGFEGFDTSVERAWTDFQVRLADIIAAMREDDLLALELGEESTVEGFVPCVQFLAWGAGEVRCEVPSNAYLDPRHRLSAADEQRLVELGWHRPTRQPDDEPDAGSPAFFVDKPANWADQLAAMAVTVFRETWSVPHPSFLRTEAVGTIEALSIDPVELDDEESFALDPGAAVVPRDDEHLYQLVALTLARLFDEPPGDDEHSDFLLALGRVVGFVGPHLDGGEVQVRVPLVRDVSDRTRASELIADLNRRWPHLKFTLTTDRVEVWAAVLANPYVPQHLIDMLEQLFAFVRTVDDAFADRFGGHLEGLSEPDPAPMEVDHGELTLPPPAPQPLRQMELFSDPGEQTLFDEPN
ncbi:hypothetical protein FK531_20310 [Rhodococcus spelaei]|uniref:YbjN domain-containing protein n=1 Tax=Rhodococcus spelaei TaxID=2546320 RepID=A0A541B0D5_9NOCA|nr:hypothetical protein [Rhodococcus spelaei]TQF65775.1 hypothetical protein FK531_20310 [Rhodococcus spelaei]